jgi:uncharacterized RDD family membrane protein YckC
MTEFADEARQALRDLVARYGIGLADEPHRVQGLLRDLAGSHRREISALVVAAEEGVGAALLTASDSLGPATADRLAQRLQSDRALTEDAAQWAVKTWAIALGVHIGAPAPTQQPEARPSPPPSSLDGDPPLRPPPAPTQPATRPISPPWLAASPPPPQPHPALDTELAGPWLRLGSWLLDTIIQIFTLGIGWLIWAAFIASEGQTPGKRLLNLRVKVFSTGAPATLGRMFWLRGVIGGFVVWIAVSFTLGIVLLMPFWDDRNQTLWDKLSGCIVVVDPVRTV